MKILRRIATNRDRVKIFPPLKRRRRNRLLKNIFGKRECRSRNTCEYVLRVKSRDFYPIYSLFASRFFFFFWYTRYRCAAGTRLILFDNRKDSSKSSEMTPMRILHLSKIHFSHRREIVDMSLLFVEREDRVLSRSCDKKFCGNE